MTEETKTEPELEKITPLSDSEINDVAMGLFTGSIFCSEQVSKGDAHLIPSIFMPIALGGESLSKLFTDNEIGLVYENMHKAAPRGVNGYPMFFSCKFMLLSDWKRVMPIVDRMKKAVEAAKLPIQDKEKTDAQK